MASPEKDQLLDHDADGIREFDNDLPLWWLFGFIFTVAFSAVYLINYHLAGGPSSQAEYEAEITASSKGRAPQGGATPAQVAALKPLTDEKSLAAGKAIFEGANMCYTCHRYDLGGMVGPNLTDDYWIHGGDFKSIIQSIKTGYPDKGMLPYGNGNRLTDEQVLQLASYIRSKHGTNPPNPKPIDPQREVKYVETEQTDADAKHDVGGEHEKKREEKRREESEKKAAQK